MTSTSPDRLCATAQARTADAIVSRGEDDLGSCLAAGSVSRAPAARAACDGAVGATEVGAAGTSAR
ncbi:MAG: hypothetical protein KF894_32735, partial [Labilithrix sp.]|nr:hypothetical protein [Labilithrix sp.]